MSRPGLIVGLGGTGQWVLTWLKRDLMLSNNGKMPDNVKLLAIDTATQLEAGTSRVTASGSKEEGAEVGGVSLDKSEFIYIGGDSRELAERVREGKLQQIGSWYKAQQWLDTQAPATFILDDGAGRIRQFGRMAWFKDMLGQETGSRTWRAFRSAIESVRAATSEQRRLEIMVVGSFAGGTGSGMFLDAALILRLLAQRQNVHHVLRGFFALPSVFTNAPDRDMKARTFAAWRELNRFMVINSDFPMPLIEYVENHRDFRIQPSDRIFDACYLVDGRRAGQPLAEESQYGVFPMMAEVVSAILDNQAGTAYTQWIFTNLAPEYAKKPDTPMYSAVGAYTVQVPAHFVQELSSHELGQDVLLSLLKPRREPDEYGRLVTMGAERHLALAAPDRNLEDKGYAGRRRSRSLLEANIAYNDLVGRPTLYMKRIAELNETSQDEEGRAKVVDLLARAGGNLRSRASWVTYYPDLGEDPEFEALRRRVREFNVYDVRTQYARGEKETRADFNARIKKMPDDILTRFGSIRSSGEEIEEYYGQYGDVLDEVQKTQMIIYRRLLQLRLLEILMGKSDDAIVARSGKLGYAWDYFDGVVQELDDFLKLMNSVGEYRQEIKPEIKFVGLSKQAQNMLRETEDAKLFWIFEHPKVKRAEKASLEAEQRLVDMRREDILHRYVTNTAREMKAAAEEARDSLQRWIWHLGTGDDAGSVPGLWDSVRASKQSVENAHSFDTRTPKVQSLLGDDPIPVDKAELEEVLSRWTWAVGYTNTDDSPKLTLKAEIIPKDEASGEAQTLNDPSLDVTTETRLSTGARNQTKLMNLVREPFTGVVARSTVAQAIVEQYPDPVTFANEVANISAEPLFDGDPQASPRKKSNLIRVMADEANTYFSGANGLQGELRGIHSLDRQIRDDAYGIQVVGSENPYKLTFVRTDDLYEYQHFSAWEECEEAYLMHLEEGERLMDPVLLQNFSAEAQAVAYERRLSREPYNRAYQPLHPRVVMLLEDPVALRQFLYLGMLEMITEAETRGLSHWELTWEKSRGPQTIWLTRGWQKDRDEGQRPKPDIFNATHGYVIMGATQEPGRQDRIDKEFAQRLIDSKLEEMGPASEIKLLKDNLEEYGFVGWLEDQAYDPDVPTRIVRPDYHDLALVAKMILQDRISELEEREAITSRRQSRGGNSPFKVYQGNGAGQKEGDDGA